MAMKKFTAEELRKARKSGFRKKAPKKPKTSASVSTLESYVSRFNAYVDEMKAKAKETDKKDKLLKEIKK